MEFIDTEKLKHIADEMYKIYSCSVNPDIPSPDTDNHSEQTAGNVERVGLWEQSEPFTLADNKYFETGAFYHFLQEGNMEGYFQANHYDSEENVLWAWNIVSHEIKENRDVLLTYRDDDCTEEETPEFAFIAKPKVGMTLADDMVFYRCGLAETIEAKHRIHQVVAQYCKHEAEQKRKSKDL